MRRNRMMDMYMRRDMMPRRDRRIMRDNRMDENYNEDYNRYNDREYPMYERDRASHYPFRVEGEFGRYDGHHYPMYPDYTYGDMRGNKTPRYYDYDSNMLGEEDIEYWSEKLKKEVEEKDKQFFTKENIKKKAMEMGIKFDKFSMEEFMVTALMMYTDYCKTLGTANMDTYLRLAKDWLCDEDTTLRYGEKLASYYDYIVEGQD